MSKKTKTTDLASTAGIGNAVPPAAARPLKRISILLQRSHDAFYQKFGTAFLHAAEKQVAYEFDVNVVFMDEVSPTFIAQKLREESELSDGLAVVTLDHHYINQAIKELTEQNKPVITLLTQISAPCYTTHVGLDSRKSGRTAAWAISRLTRKEGSIGIMLGSHRYLNQEIAEINFASYFRDLGKPFQLLKPVLDLDEDQLAATATRQLLANNPDLVGIYSIGGGVAGILDVLREQERGADLVVVCNELTEVTRPALATGLVDLVIATPVDRMSEEVIALFSRAFSMQGKARFHPLLLPPDLYVEGNI